MSKSAECLLVELRSAAIINYASPENRGGGWRAAAAYRDFRNKIKAWILAYSSGI